MYVKTTLNAEYNYYLIDADDGIEGFAVSKKEAPNLIILDMDIPGMGPRMVQPVAFL